MSRLSADWTRRLLAGVLLLHSLETASADALLWRQVMNITSRALGLGPELLLTLGPLLLQLRLHVRLDLSYPCLCCLLVLSQLLSCLPVARRDTPLHVTLEGLIMRPREMLVGSVFKGLQASALVARRMLELHDVGHLRECVELRLGQPVCIALYELLVVSL